MTAGRGPRHAIGRLATPWRTAYGARSGRSFGFSLLAVPLALRQAPRAVRGGRLRALAGTVLALPVALASTALTATLAFLVLINVLAYPFRSLLGLPGPTDGSYQDAWGGPTLAGAWATHAGLVLVLVVPPVAWAVRRLTALQRRLTDIVAVRSGTIPPEPVRPLTTPAVAASSDARRVDAARVDTAPVDAASAGVAQVGVARVGRTPVRVARMHRPVTVVGAVALFVGFSLTAHAAGIGDNLLWTPRDLTSTLALAGTLAPLAALPVLARTPWWRRQH